MTRGDGKVGEDVTMNVRTIENVPLRIDMPGHVEVRGEVVIFKKDFEEINKKQELNDEDVITVLSKQIKTRKESITEFEKAGRTDLVEQTKKEIEILNKYMPEQLSEEDVLKVIDEAFNELKPEKPSDMGKLMGFVTPKLKGKADMSFVSKTIKEKLANL